MPSATFAERRLSIAASNATAKPADISSRTSAADACGSAGNGSDPGSAPMRATSRPHTFATIVATTTASSDAGHARRTRIVTTIVATTTATMPIAARLPVTSEPPSPIASPTALAATAAVFSPAGFATPRAAGTCWRKMITAIPTVNPSTTGHGMYAR